MLNIPVLVLVLFIFALVVFASAKKMHLGLAAIIGGIIFAIARGLPPFLILKAVVDEITKPDTILLLILVMGIMVFSQAMKKSGAMDAFAASLVAIIPSKRLSLALAPLIIGTLPMPGGAIISAPIVDAFDNDRSLGGGTLSSINYWFRHNLELAWPLYPAFILTSTMANISAARLMLLNIYAAPILFVLGLIFILPPRKKLVDQIEILKKTETKKDFKKLFAGFAPLLIVLLGYALLDRVAGWLLPVSGINQAIQDLILHYLPIFIALLVASLYLLARPGSRDAFKGALTGNTLKLTAVVAGIRIFAALLDAGNAATASALELARMGIAPILAAAFLPFIAGLVTGVGFGYVGLAFPIVIGLFPAGSTGFPMEAAIVFGGVFGYAGMMLSPLHVCMVVSSAHFQTGLSSVLKRLLVPMTIFTVLGSLYALLLGYVIL